MRGTWPANSVVPLERGWNLRPGISGTLCCSACTWTNSRIQRNYKGLKITACMRNWGKLWTIRYKKTQNPTATSGVSGAKAGYHAWSLHTAPPRGWAHHPSHPSRLSPGPILTLTPFKGPACWPCPPPQGGSEGSCYLLLLYGSTSPHKALPEFLIWPLINFYWLKSPRTLVGNTPSRINWF